MSKEKKNIFSAPAKISTAEKRLLDWTDRFLPLLMVLVASGLALYLRRGMIWYTVDGLNAGFDGHDGFVESYLRYGIVRLVQYLPILPAHSIKWICGLSDFLLAAAASVVFETKNPFKQGICYTLVLFLPVVFLRGVVTAQFDSLALTCLLGALLLLEKNSCSKAFVVAAVVLAALGCALVPPMLIGVLLYCFCKQKRWECALTFVIAVFLQGVCAYLCTGEWSFWECLYPMFRYLYLDPYTGVALQQLREWIMAILYGVGLLAGVSFLLLAGRKKQQSYVLCAFFVNLLLTIVYSSYLFHGDTFVR